MTMQHPFSSPPPPPPHSDPAQGAPDALEALLTQQLKVALEPQRGKALAAFRAQVAREAPLPMVKGVIPRRALWYWAGVPSLIAASLAVVVTLQAVNRPAVVPAGGDGGVRPVAAGMGGGEEGASGAGLAAAATGVSLMPGAGAEMLPSPTIVFNQRETLREVNGGFAVLSDNTPVQIIRRQQTRQTQWVDPREQAVYSLTEEPIENVGYTRVQPY